MAAYAMIRRRTKPAAEWWGQEVPGGVRCLQSVQRGEYEPDLRRPHSTGGFL